MAQQNAEQEPTMEEILASIRRIINEDEEEGGDQPETEDAQAQAEAEPEADPEPAEEAEAEAEPEPDPAPDPEPEPEPAAASDEDDDVLELTERVEDDETPGTDPMTGADDLMIVDREDEEPAEADAEPDPAPAPEPAPEPANEDDSLLGTDTAGAASAAFAALSENLRVSSENGQTLEGIVRELMKPMLKQWLDENLPSIVEEKVQEEIERVARRRR